MQEQTLIVDTGSQLTCMPCKGYCEKCGNHISKQFDTKSKNSQLIYQILKYLNVQTQFVYAILIRKNVLSHRVTWKEVLIKVSLLKTLSISTRKLMRKEMDSCINLDV